MPTPFSTLPITLGVTGHRDAQDAPQLLAILDAQISDIAARYPHSPLVALSSLAEGADRLFARVIMEKGLALHVILPFTQAEYEKDFQATVAEFRELLDYAHSTGGVHVIETVIPGSGEMISLNTPPVYRDLQYARAGMYLAQRCHILFALWDGKPARGLGGTAQVVKFRREGRIDERDLDTLNDTLPGIKRWLGQSNLLDVPDTGLVCHLQVRRSEGAFPDGVTAPSVCWYPPQPADAAAPDEESWYHSLQKLDRLNRDLLAEEKKHPGTDHDHFCPAAFTHVDRLANSGMTDIRSHYKWIFGLAAAMTIAGNRVPGDVERWVVISLTLSLVFLALLMWRLSRVHRSKANKAATERRALAEGLRVQNVWRQVGIARSVSLHYLRRDHGINAWIRRAMLGASVYPWGGESTRESDLRQALVSVKQNWVASQHTYFVSKVAAKEAQNHKVKTRARNLFFAGTALTALVLFSSLLSLYDAHLGHTLHPLNWAGEHLAEFLLASAALCAAWGKFLGYEEDIADYERSAALFGTALAKIEVEQASASADIDDLQDIIYVLGIETLQENARWVTRTIGRDVEVIGG